MTRAPRQTGFSLVELMVALVVALLLLAGVLQILLGNRESLNKQKTLAGMQENARLTSFVIENAVAHAGYRVELQPRKSLALFPATTDKAGGPAALQGLNFSAGAVVASKDGTDGSDAVRLRLQASGGVHDCQGNEVGGPGDDNPQIGDFALYVNTKDNLECVVYKNGKAGQPQPLVSNVDRFKATYGLDTNSDDSVDTYVKDLNKPGYATEVRSLRLQLLLRTKKNVLPHGFKRTYAFADDTHITIPARDRRARQLVDQTVALRNLLP